MSQDISLARNAFLFKKKRSWQLLLNSINRLFFRYATPHPHPVDAFQKDSLFFKKKNQDVASNNAGRKKNCAIFTRYVCVLTFPRKTFYFIFKFSKRRKKNKVPTVPFKMFYFLLLKHFLFFFFLSEIIKWSGECQFIPEEKYQVSEKRDTPARSSITFYFSISFDNSFEDVSLCFG